MKLNYKLITKDQLPTEARVSFAIRDTEFYCWLMKDHLMINSKAPHVDQVLDALRCWWQYETIDEDADHAIDTAYKIILSHWDKQGADQALEVYHKALDQYWEEQHEAWAIDVLSRYSGEKGLDILDSLEHEDSYLYNTLYSVATKLHGSKQGWNDFVRCAYLYAYHKGIEAAQRASS